MKAIEVTNLTKRYGAAVAVDNISFSVNKGDFFGFIGPNGAGKTTTIKSLLGLLRINTGRVRVLGQEVPMKTPLDQIGYIPGEANLYENLTVNEQVAYFTRYYERVDSVYLQRLQEMFQLSGQKRIGDLSLGNKKKVAIVCALMIQPQLLLCDEASSGLDPLMQQVLFQELATLNGQGTTIFFSSHNLEEVQQYCRNVAIIKEGRLVAIDNMAEVAKKVGVRVTLRAGKAADLGWLNEEGIIYEPLGKTGASFIYRGEINQLVRRLGTLKLRSLRVADIKLEEIFADYYHR